MASPARTPATGASGRSSVPLFEEDYPQKIVNGIVFPGKSGILDRLAEVKCDHDVPVFDKVEGRLLGHGSTVLCLAAGRQHDNFLLSTSKDCTCRLWDLEHGACTRTINGHTDAIRSAVFSLDDRLIFTAGDNTVRVWDRTSDREVACFRGHQGHVTSIDVQMRCFGSTSYGLTLISSSFDCTTKVWDLRSKMAIRTCIGHQRPITSCVLLSDGKTVISGSLDAQCRVFDAGLVAAATPFTLSNPAGQCRMLRTIKATKSAISRVRVSADNKWLATCSHDGLCAITRLGPDTNTQLIGHNHSEGCWDCAWHNSGNMVATAGGRNVIIWDIGYLMDYELSKVKPIITLTEEEAARQEMREKAKKSAEASAPPSTSGRTPVKIDAVGSGRIEILPAKALVKLTGAGIKSQRFGSDGDRLSSILWLTGSGFGTPDPGAGFSNRLNRAGVIVAGSQDGSIAVWTVPKDVTDSFPHMFVAPSRPETAAGWLQTGGGQVLNLETERGDSPLSHSAEGSRPLSRV